MRKYVSVGIGLSKPMLERVDRLAVADGVSRNELCRKLFDSALLNAERSVTPDLKRLLVLQEHQSLVLDALARERIPDQADSLALSAVDAMKKHHGA